MRIHIALLLALPACSLFTDLDGLGGTVTAPDAAPADVASETSTPETSTACDAGAPDPNLLGDAIAISAGGNATCAVRAGGDVVCWGGKLAGSSPKPIRVKSIPAMRAVRLSDTRACAITKDDHAWCWDATSAPAEIADGSGVPISGIADVAVGAGHACALFASGSVVCWGANANGELGSLAIGASSDHPVAVQVDQGARIVAGANHTCVIRTSVPNVMCWGLGSSGQLGVAPLGDAGTWSSPPIGSLLAPSEGVPVRLASTANTTCAVDDGGDVFCTGTTGFTPVAGLSDGKTLDGAMDSTHSCVVREDHTVGCIGGNGVGQLGLGSIDYKTHAFPLPVVRSNDVELTRAIAVTVGGSHSCALVADTCGTPSRVGCWGWNDEGALGNGSLGGVSTVALDVIAP